MKIENVKCLIEALNSDARNAMHSILGFLELVSEGALDPAQQEYVEACRAVADGHCRDIGDMSLVLDLVPEETQVMTDFAPEDLFTRVAEIIGVIAARKGIGLFCKVDIGVPPAVSADADRIEHALFRMAECLVKTMDVGDVHLNLGAILSADGFILRFEIVSPLRKLAQASMSALQQDEFEFDASLSGGGALGLAAARRLITVLGGHVDAASDGSTGTRIQVTMPVAVSSGAMPLSQMGGRVTPKEQGSLRILVAEDSEDSFQLFKAYLRSQPHAVTRATNGAEAVELATTGFFDLLFVDIRMPVMDGYAATRRIRELETGKDRRRLPIVVLSGENLRAQRRHGALVGCSGYLSKPLRKSALLEAVRVFSMQEPPIPVV